MPAPTLLTVDEVLDRLPISRTTLYQLFRTGKLPKRKLMGRTVVAENDLAALVDASAVVVAPPRPKAARRQRSADVVEFFK